MSEHEPGQRGSMHLVRELQHAFRLLRKDLRYSLIAILTLGLGVAASTVIFSLIDATLLQRLPFDHPDRLVVLSELNLEVSARPVRVSFPDFGDWQKENTIFQKMAAYRDRKMTFKGVEPVRIDGVAVSEDFFGVLGAEASKGHTFSSADAGNSVAVVSDKFWHNHLEGRDAVLDSVISLDGKQYTIVGVMPRNFRFLADSDIWIPLEVPASMRQMRGAHFLDVIGRLQPGISLEQARAGMDTVAARLGSAYPETNAGWTVAIDSLQERLTGNFAKRLSLLFGAVAFVLLITTANVSGLLLARAYSRQREFAIRLSLGATGRKIIWQMLSESLAVGLSGGTVGILLTYLFIRMLPSWRTLAQLHIDRIEANWTVALFGILIALLASVLFGVLPAFEASKSDVNLVLKGYAGNSQTGIQSPRPQRWRNLLLIIEIAVAELLLSGAGLFSRSLIKLESTDPGFEPSNLISMQIPLSPTKYSEPASEALVFTGILDRVIKLPTVESAAFANAVPLSGVDPKLDFSLGSTTEWASTRTVTSNYFRTLGIPLRQGRVFKGTDTAESHGVVIINEELVKSFVAHGINPLGQTLRLGESSFEVVGVVGNVREKSLAADLEPEMYFPMVQAPQSTMILIARSKSDPIKVVPDLRSIVHSIDQDQPIENIETLEEIVSNSIAPPRFSALLFGILSGLALILAAAGVYGVVAYMVERRTHEIGIRLALGARVNQVVGLVVRRGMLLGLIGTGIGLTLTLLLSRTAASLLFGISALDLLTLAVVSAILLGITAIACYVPARHAARIPPVESMRYEK